MIKDFLSSYHQFGFDGKAIGASMNESFCVNCPQCGYCCCCCCVFRLRRRDVDGVKGCDVGRERVGLPDIPNVGPLPLSLGCRWRGVNRDSL